MTTAPLAAQLRHAIETLMASDHDEAALLTASEHVTALTAALDKGVERDHDRRVERFAEQMVGPLPDDGESFSPFEESPVSGPLNPLSPLDVDIRRDGDGVQATVTLGVAMQGAPARSHGGIICALFDDFMGANQRVIRRFGYTRSLDVTFRRPFPLGEKVVFSIIETPADEGLFAMEATATANGKVVATAIGIFTDISADRFFS